ncbi:ABC transporter ATP-binding protein [[Clostridium] fimetarium]
MIKVNNVAFSYTKKPFLENINFEVKKGEIFGLLGPSGAGKSTLQKILTGLLNEYKGSAIIDGIESRNHTNSFYEKIGVDFEFPSLYEKLTAKDNLKYFGSLYKGKKKSIDELLEIVGLHNDADKKVAGFSKGMKSRLNFIKSLIHNPDILFLDEPTSGLDPTNARILKDIIIKEREAGKTIILTTHNMEDATELCDRVAFIVDGHIEAMDTPHHLIMSRGACQVSYSFLNMKGSEVVNTVSLDEVGSDMVLQDLIINNKLIAIHSSEPNLNDIFMEVTGRVLQ